MTAQMKILTVIANRLIDLDHHLDIIINLVLPSIRFRPNYILGQFPVLSRLRA